jgi:hypothetical protein
LHRNEIAFMSSFEPGIHRPHLRRRSSDPDFVFPEQETSYRRLHYLREARIQIMRVNVLRRFAGPLDGRE